MPKNFFNRIKESMSSSPKENIPMGDKEHDFERTKDVLFSSKNLEQLVSAIKYINNFNKKYRIHEKSPEFIYFGRMIKLMKSKLRSNRFKIDDELSEGERLSPRIKNIIRESLGDLSWIKDTQPNFKPNFPFEGKEQWVDVCQLNQDERKKLVDYIREALPNFKEWGVDGLGDIRRGNRKGIVIHCGSDSTNYEPEENLLCFADNNYEEDYAFNDPLIDIPNIYIDGREVVEYIDMMYGDEELDESLEWTDKDGSFDGKDKSFENDPDWKNDESWASNPERSYWKQGDAGGSAGGGDMNESQDLDWIRDVSDRLPTYDQRTRVDLKDFLLDYAEDNLSVIDFLHNEDLYIPTDDYRRRYTPEEWDEYGTDRWRDGDFKEHGQWIEDPWVTSWELMEELEEGCNKWEFIDRTTEDYDLEIGSYNDLFIFKRKKDGRYFALGVSGSSYEGMNDNEDFLYEVFPKMKLVYESRKKLIKKILREGFDWIQDNSISGDELEELIRKTGATSIPFDRVSGNLSLEETPIQSLGNLESVGGYLYLVGTKIKDLGNLQSVGGDLYLGGTPIQSLGNLETVGGHLDLWETPIQSLGNLESVGGNLNLRGTPIKDLGNLQSVGGYLNLGGTKIKDLGNLETVGGHLYLVGTPIQSLGNLQSVGGNLNLRETKIKDLGNLQSVGGYLYLVGTPMSKKYSEQEIRQMVQVNGDIYL